MTDHKINNTLLYVVRGQEDEARPFFQTSPDYLLCRGDITDYSGRHFSNITPFEYALWALDSHMWKMMLKCIPVSAEGNDIRKKLLSLYEEVRTQGLSYTFENKKIVNEHHFDFEQLKTALKTYFKEFDISSVKERNHAWCLGVGIAQRNLPAHVAQEYCFPNRSFEPTPQFNEPNLPRSLKFYNKLTDTDDEWWGMEDSSVKLGVDFAIVGPRLWVQRPNVEAVVPRGLVPLAAKPAVVDLAAITALHTKRRCDFEKLKHELMVFA